MDVLKAIKILKDGGVVVFPTDTVWGVGASMDSKEGVEKLYKIKNRKKDKPTAILVGSMDQAEKYGDFNDVARDLAIKHWPGALTVVVPAKKGVNKEILNDEGGVGIRYAKNKLVKELCEGLGGGIVATSANFAGEESPKSLSEVSNDFLNSVDGVIGISDGGGKSSTVVDCMRKSIKVLRQGDIFI